MTDPSKPPTFSNEGGIDASKNDCHAAMNLETSIILGSPEFLTSPTLIRLLKWLVLETVSGRGGNVKSYNVAVDGLGRHHGFDTKADSYPRVQISRLRRALTSHYAHVSSIDGLCLYLRQGSYQVYLDRMEIAYPQLLRTPLARDGTDRCLPDPSKIILFRTLAPFCIVLLALTATALIFIAVLAAMLVAPELASVR